MGVENPSGRPEQPKNPLQEARSAWNVALLGREYKGGALIGGFGGLRNVLVDSPEAATQQGKLRLARELHGAAANGVLRAQHNDDPDTAGIFETYEHAYALAVENLSEGTTHKATATVSAAPIPQRSVDRMPMSDPKGGPRTPAAGAKEPPKPPTNPDDASASATPRRRGRPPKNPVPQEATPAVATS